MKTIMLYGRRGVGKTYLAESFPLSLKLSFYPKDSFPATPPPSLAGVRDFYTGLVAGGQRTIVLDGFDALYGLVEKDVCAELGIPQMGVTSTHIEWGLARDKLIKILSGFTQTKHANYLILTLGADAQVIEGLGVTGYSPSLPPSIKRAVLQHVNLLGYVSLQRSQDDELNPITTVDFIPAETYDAGGSGAPAPLSVLWGQDSKETVGKWLGKEGV